MATIGRRTLVVGASVVGLGAAAGILAFRGGVHEGPLYPGSAAYFEAVAEDYRSGRVVVLGGWIFSATEMGTLDLPIDQPGGPSTTSSAPDAT